MSLELTNGVHGFNNLLSSFITCEHIEEVKVKDIESIVGLVEQYKLDFLSRKEHRPIDLINIYSGLNLLKNFFICAQNHLLEGITKKENPKSAKEVFEFSEDIVILANLIDEFKLNEHKDTPSYINKFSIELRERLREKELFPSIDELSNYKGVEGSYVDKIFAKAID